MYDHDLMNIETWYILDKFSNLGITDNWAPTYAFGMSCSYLFALQQHIFLCRKSNMVPYYCGRHYIDQQISCIHVQSKKVKLQQLITNESLLNGACII